ncbi:MAG: hypothetical protein KGJ80_09380 [Chloroflexota bacterium]|nr:hypothetical protein [Chloroflexota bacterium]
MNKSLTLAFFAFVFAATMLTFSRAFDMRADEGTMFAVTDSIIKFGQTSIDQADHLQYIHAAAIGLDGARYAKYGLGQSLAALPLYLLGLVVPAIGLIDATLLLNPLATALAATVVMLAAIELGASRGRALALALVYAFCTTAWVYAKNFYSEPLMELGLAIACWGIAMMLTRQRSIGAGIAGAGIGLAALIKSSAVVVAPVLLFVALRYGGARRWRFAFAAAAPIALAVIVIGFYNWSRFGNPAASGYGSDESFTVFPLVGAFGMLFAPGRSLFIYAPILLAAVPGLWLLRRPAGMRVWLIGAALAVLLVHGAWWSWWGAWAWGPRLSVPLLPMLSLGLLGIFDPAIAQTNRSRARIKIAAVSSLAALSFLMQLPGVLVYRTFFFWDVMKAVPNVDPDVVSLYTFQFFMPLFNLGEIVKGNLDLTFKPGFDAPVDVIGLLIAISGGLIGSAGLALAWRGGRGRRVAAVLSAGLVLGAALLGLAHYHAEDGTAFRSLWATVDARVPPNALLLFSDGSLDTNRALWNDNRDARRVVGVAADPGQMELHTLQFVRRAFQIGQPVWYLQTEPDAPDAFIDDMHKMGLCETPYEVDNATRLIQWSACAP